VQTLPILTEDRLKEIVTGPLRVERGDVVVIHASMGNLHLGFPYHRIVSLIREIVGEEGTLLFPTYPKLTSYRFLLSGEIFDIRNSPSYTGILSEFARRHDDSIRSLHPTKSVCTIGADADEITNTHHQSIYPCDTFSPFHKILNYSAKVIGLGITAQHGLSPAHTVEDAMVEDFPVGLYHERLFHAKCIDQNGEFVVVKTYGHNIDNMRFRVPPFMKEHVPENIGEGLRIDGTEFYWADIRRLFDLMLRLARKGITIYPESCYKKGWK